MRSTASARSSVLHAAIATSALLLLAGCGGGGSGNAGVTNTVSRATFDRASYGQTSTITVTGTELNASGVSFSATGCDGLAVQAGGTALQQVLTCTPNKALSIGLSAKSNGTEFFSTTVAVPKPQVTLTTSRGTIVVELEPAVVQATVDNFLAYVKAGYYDGTIFHRVVSGFVVQGGGFTAYNSGTGVLTPQTGLRAPIALETNKGLSNTAGTIAMARTNAFDSATSQFYFNAVDNLSLNYQSAASPGYAVFGRIVTGLAVMSDINARPTDTNSVPLTTVSTVTARQTQ